MIIEAFGTSCSPDGKDKSHLVVQAGIKAGKEYLFPEKKRDNGPKITLEMPMGDFLLVLGSIKARLNSCGNRNHTSGITENQNLWNDFAAKQMSAFNELNRLEREKRVALDGTEELIKIEVRPGTAISMMQALAGTVVLSSLKSADLNLRDSEDERRHRDNIATKIHSLSIMKNLLFQMAEQNLPVAREKLEELRETLGMYTALKESI